jgi:hypothetical protein
MPAARNMRTNRIHDGGSRRNRAAAEVIAIGKPARKHRNICPLRQRMIRMPGMNDICTGKPKGMRDILLSVDSRKGNDGGTHQPSTSTL